MGGPLQETDHARDGKRRSLDSLPAAASLALGWTLLLLGVVALFVPILPGALLILAGGGVLRRQSSWVRKVSDECRERVCTQSLGAFLGWQVPARSLKRCERFRSPHAPHVSRLRAKHETSSQQTFERRRNARAQA
jgi:hypothetical protein